ncbi:MAG: carbohydrate kinase [Spirochaetaceae bacterium]|jgi:L-xylulokinase|nr:carbohydrate kinase [Spirochaetaceae bacterium]
MAQYVAGFDNGGTMVKAAIFDLTGRQIIARGTHTPVLTPQPGWTERDCEELWAHNAACMRSALDESGIKNTDILGVSVCGHGKGLYTWGKKGRPAYNGIVSTDGRAWAYPEKWYKAGIPGQFADRLWQRILASQQVSLLAWLKDHERAVYDDIQWVFSVKDFIRYRLTGEAYAEATDFSGSGLMNIRDARFDRDMLEAFGIGEVYEKIAPLKYSQDLCGCVSREAAALTGLCEGTPVAGGMFDIDACAIAMDVTSPDDFCTIAGTWSINEYVASEPVRATGDGGELMNSLFAIPGLFLVESCSPTSAGNLDWFLDRFVHAAEIPSGANRYGYIDGEVEKIAPEACDVCYLPFLNGSNDNPLGRACLTGMTAYHEKMHAVRAVYEGVAFSHKTHIERLLATRQPPRAVRMAGGAVNSACWVQMFADVLGLPVETVDAPELGALGCSMSAAVAAGVYGDYREAARKMVRVKARVEPDARRGEIYQKKYEKYTALRRALEPVWGVLARPNG